MNLAPRHHHVALAVAIALASGALPACAVPTESAEEVATATQADEQENGLTWNGLTWNGLTWNGLTWNGLTTNGLALTPNAGEALATEPNAQLLFSYIVSCALPPGQSVTVSGITFDGSVGVAPEWGVDGGRCDGTCQQWVSACVISRVDYLGVHVPLSIRGDNPALALVPGEATAYPDREATYFGNVFTVPQELYACRAAGDDPTLIGRPCGHGADVAGCAISVLDEKCQHVCSVTDSAIGYFGSCATPDDGTFVPAVTVYRQ